ncbi:methylaspartate mutase [Polymorphospora rubra]|uniref:methylaspartate mutase n=1 Tax=Polymorphospora rubra TaxID=338584 RepID=UPI001BB3D0A8|nr:methylaspartate mutase [Polymorphospora rubra]
MTLVDYSSLKPRSFGEYVRSAYAEKGLVVQPRMGFAEPARMAAGLAATRAARANTVGTITVDSYTRVGDHEHVRTALEHGLQLNGYPIVDHPADVTAKALDGILSESFPVQVRHGSARPGAIFAALSRLGLDASEGGPVSYCLPYGRVPLRESINNWSEATSQFAFQSGGTAHLETFGGCLLGQLCPPSVLVALSVLEARFFCLHGVSSVSLSYAQQTHFEQDIEAVAAMRRLATEFVPARDVHFVLYAYMGVYPRTRKGALELLREAAHLAVATGMERLIVKTSAEAHRIPTIAENVEALEEADDAARHPGDRHPADPGNAGSDCVYREARNLVEAVLELSPDLSRGLHIAFRRGILDIPFCLHPDNAGRTRSRIDPQGRLQWLDVGSMPISPTVEPVGPSVRLTSQGLLADLNLVRDRFDRPELAGRKPVAPID